VSWKWEAENPPRWSAAKARVLASAPPGVFAFEGYADGDLLPGQWWRVGDETGETLGYGWMDCNWGDGEILVAVAGDHRRKGVGSFILEHLQDEARARGLNYLYNVVPAAHPEPAALEAWLAAHGFSRHGDGRLMRGVTARQRPPTTGAGP
jgi:GNAT superfamily N-acetyltransferase